MAKRPPKTTPSTGTSQAKLERIDRLGYLLDSSIRIPGIGYRIGYDAIIGLVPGFGDLAGFALSAYIVLEASRFGLPKATLARMVFNVGLEALVGTIPLIGDLFDATFKANARNLALLHAHLDERKPEQRAADRRFVLYALLGLIGALVLFIFLIAVVVEALSRLLGP